ncbi:hypothetical protein [Dokdonella ginsengisoli]|uniref:Ig-like domain-containing protein n=1 Tax=Dokdonella ginsengisoli TaxID=363846 RepID=A0ABV9QRP6_9GAMM
MSSKMHSVIFRSAPLMAGAMLLASGSSAHAQAVVRMTTTQQTSCVATTDASGLQLVPGSTDLQATGVSLSGTGCGGSGGQTDDYQVAVTAPPTATVGGSFNVTWSASSAATSCTYGGSTSGVSGWNVGASACTGAACAGSHNVPVTITSSGAYTFGVTCTNSTGTASAGVNAGVGAPTPANFALTAPTSVGVNEQFQVSWAVQNATKCVGTATKDGAAVTLSGWTTVETTSSPRNVTASQEGSYVLSMRCENTAGSVTSQNATVAVTQNTTSCPAGLQNIGDLAYSVNFNDAPTNPKNVDLTQFKNIWGRKSTSDTIVDFPGVNFYAIFKTLDRTKYISAKFRVPANGLNPATVGSLSKGENYIGPYVTTSISTTCGEFNQANIAPYCLTTNRGAAGAVLAKWKLTTGSPGVFACALTPGQEYYLNIKVTDPAAPNADCAGNICKMNVQNRSQ